MTTAESLQKAAELLRAGQPAEAALVCREILSTEPNYGPALYLSGAIAVQDSRNAEALGYLERAVAVDPFNPAYLVGVGEVLHRLGRLNEAQTNLERALGLDRNFVAAHYNLARVCRDSRDVPRAVAALRETLRLLPDLAEGYEMLAGLLREQGDPAAALECLRAHVARRPDSAEAHNSLGNLLCELGRFDEAADVLRTAVGLRSDAAILHYNLANTLRAQGKRDEAAACYREAVRLAPGLVPALNNLGTLLHEMGDLPAAGQTLAEAARQAPESAEVQHNFGVVLRNVGEFQPAKAAFERAVKLNPNRPESHYHLGAVLVGLKQWDPARRHLLEALRLKPDYAHAYAGLGGVALAEGEFREALLHYDRALELDSSLAEVHFNRGTLLLGFGDPAGWPEYEWRSQVPAIAHPLTGQRWQGEPLENRSILLYTEQGLGDALQFIRYAPRIQARGATVIVCCEARMVPILRTCAGIDQFCDPAGQPPHFDFYASLLSLPGIFAADADPTASQVPYLAAPPGLVDQWRRRLAPDGRLRVGINWQGNPAYGNDHHRSIPLAAFAPLAQVEGVRLISLQKGLGVEQLTSAPFAVADLGSQLDLGDAAFCETAAVIANLDLVITSDTAVAHLAGALGANVWLALSKACDWRWLFSDRQDSAWYPTMRLFRQPKLDRWNDVFERMAGELPALVAAARTRTSGG
jgi:tetratricopeptide (TPR) repeat protein